MTAPLFRRPFFVQAPLDGAATSGGEVQYLRLHGHSENPGAILEGKRLTLAAGGTLDVVVDGHGGLGLGRVAYTTGLRASVKRGAQLTYRFELPHDATAGSSFQVTCHGHDAQMGFTFHLMVG